MLGRGAGGEGCRAAPQAPSQLAPPTRAPTEALCLPQDAPATPVTSGHHSRGQRASEAISQNLLTQMDLQDTLLGETRDSEQDVLCGATSSRNLEEATWRALHGDLHAQGGEGLTWSDPTALRRLPPDTGGAGQGQHVPAWLAHLENGWWCVCVWGGCPPNHLCWRKHSAFIQQIFRVCQL